MKEEKKYTITVTEHQLALISQCVEDCHRFAAGQTGLDNMAVLFAEHYDTYHTLKNGLRELKPLVTGDEIGDYSWDGHGCPNEHQRKFIAETYCIYREILHRIRVINRREDDTYSCYDNETLTCDEGGPLPKIELVKEESK